MTIKTPALVLASADALTAGISSASAEALRLIANEQLLAIQVVDGWTAKLDFKVYT